MIVYEFKSRDINLCRWAKTFFSWLSWLGIFDVIDGEGHLVDEGIGRSWNYWVSWVSLPWVIRTECKTVRWSIICRFCWGRFDWCWWKGEDRVKIIRWRGIQHRKFKFQEFNRPYSRMIGANPSTSVFYWDLKSHYPLRGADFKCSYIFSLVYSSATGSFLRSIVIAKFIIACFEEPSLVSNCKSGTSVPSFTLRRVSVCSLPLYRYLIVSVKCRRYVPAVIRSAFDSDDDSI